MKREHEHWQDDEAPKARVLREHLRSMRRTWDALLSAAIIKDRLVILTRSRHATDTERHDYGRRLEDVDGRIGELDLRLDAMDKKLERLDLDEQDERARKGRRPRGGTMPPLLLVLLLMLVLTACATTAPPTSPTAPPPPTVAGTPPPAPPTPAKTDVIIEALDKLENNALLTAVNRDATDTITWVNGQPTLTALQTFRAKACPMSVQLATQDLQAKIELLKALLQGVQAQAAGAAAQGPELILFFTKLRYGPAGQPGSDPQAMISQLKQDIAERVTAVVDSCRAIIPIKQIDEVVQLAGKAGLAVGTAGAATPFLGLVP